MEGATGMNEHREKVWAAIDKGRLKKLGMDLVDIWSPTGEESEIAHFLGGHYESIGLASRLQEFETDRFNALGTLVGDGTGIEFLFCGHIDTSYSGKEPGLPKLPAYQPNAWSETDPATGEEWIYGLGIYNMKGAIACYVEALNAIQDAGVKLRGNVTVGAVGGEIEMGAVDQYQGKHYRGGGCGACYLATHGGTADMAVIGEPSEMRVVLGHMGYVYHKITVYGTPAHTTYAHNAVNAILKMKKILDALERWAPKYREAHPYGNSNANVNIAAIEGGWPWRCSRTPVFCNLYLDTRLLPRQHPWRSSARFRTSSKRSWRGIPTSRWTSRCTCPTRGRDRGRRIHLRRHQARPQVGARPGPGNGDRGLDFGRLPHHALRRSHPQLRTLRQDALGGAGLGPEHRRAREPGGPLPHHEGLCEPAARRLRQAEGGNPPPHQAEDRRAAPQHGHTLNRGRRKTTAQRRQ